MKVVVYVEGPGDRNCLEALLGPLIKRKEAAGVRIQFVPMTRGDRKKELVTKAPIKAANAILNDAEIVVVILPDLYPPNKGFEHHTCKQMQAGVLHVFRDAVDRKAGWNDRLVERFRVFCLIHDLEVLLLAAQEQLLAYCSLNEVVWKTPVEEQDHGDPPKRVLQRLIRNYDSTVDGPLILANADYHVVSGRCANGFGPFVSFLESITP